MMNYTIKSGEHGVIGYVYAVKNCVGLRKYIAFTDNSEYLGERMTRRAAAVLVVNNYQANKNLKLATWEAAREN